MTTKDSVIALSPEVIPIGRRLADRRTPGKVVPIGIGRVVSQRARRRVTRHLDLDPQEVQCELSQAAQHPPAGWCPWCEGLLA